MRLKEVLCLSFLLISLGAPGSFPLLFAQQNDREPPPSSSAEVIETKVREEAEEKILEKKPLAEAPMEEEKPPVEEKEPVRFYVREIRLKGMEPLSPEALESLFTPYEGREITFQDLSILSKRIERTLRAQGYLAVVFIPPQRIENGEVALQVVISRMGVLHVEGQRYSRAWRVRTYWRISRGEILRYKAMQSSLFNLNDNPDRTIRAVLRPGKEAGATDVYLKVEEEFPLHVSFTFDNQGDKLTGKERVGLNVQHSNLLTLDDVFRIGTIFGSNFGTLFIHHLIPLTPVGTSLVLGFSHAQVNPQKQFKLSGINGISQTYSLILQQKLFQTDRSLAHLHLGFDFKEKNTREQGATKTWDRLRVLSFGGDWQALDSKGYWITRQDFSFGLSPHGDGFPLNSRKGETSFFKYNFSIKRQQNLSWGTHAVFNFEGQLSPDKLTPQEELFLGGATTVRGYPESDYGADQALLANFEYLAPAFFVPKGWKLPYAGEALRDLIQLVGFLDFGYGRLRDPSGDERNSRTLMGAGGGFRVRLRKNLTARFEWAAPLKDDPLNEAGESQLHFRFDTNF